MESNVKELEASLKSSVDKCAAERQGRIRAQQELRKALLQQKTENMDPTSYPMIPIGTVQSCFSTRNGTPRQPLLVPLARACLMFDPMRVPPASLEGLEEYSHIWIIYVFHLNTDLDKLWLEPSRSKIKAKIEAVQGHMILLSGVDLVDGTPVLDVKPYLPYCDSIQDSMVPEWVKEDSLLAVASVIFSESFHSALADCWESVKRSSLYSSQSEMKKLIEQVLSWDIRSSSQRHRPHKSILTVGNVEPAKISPNGEDGEGEETPNPVSEICDPSLIVYHLNLESLEISYTIDCEGNVLVDSVAPASNVPRSNQNRCNYTMWKDKLG
uniref:TsaA-like domain-containing protein n=1 Tax=Chenopodium quinoa TaxID=63459 RepID=A0A803N4H3_CHEQI